MRLLVLINIDVIISLIRRRAIADFPGFRISIGILNLASRRPMSNCPVRSASIVISDLLSRRSMTDVTGYLAVMGVIDLDG